MGIDDTDSLEELHERFKSFLPRYGALWRSMVRKSKTEQLYITKENEDVSVLGEIDPNSNSNTPEITDEKKDAQPSLLDAIYNKKTIKMRVTPLDGEQEQTCCDVFGCLGDCVEPILEEEVDMESTEKTEPSSVENISETSTLKNNEDSKGRSSIGSELTFTSCVSVQEDMSEKENNGFAVNQTSHQDDISQLADECMDVISLNDSVSEATTENEFTDNSVDESLSDDDQTNEEVPFTVEIVDDDDIDESDGSFSCSSGETLGSYTTEEEMKDDEIDDEYESEQDDSPDPELIILSSDEEDDVDVFPRKLERRSSLKKKKEHTALSGKSFQRKRIFLTNHFFAEYNKLAFQNTLDPVSVTWSKRLLKTAGLTRLKSVRKNPSGDVERFSSIELSTKVITDEDRLKATLLHEMCHAAQWLVDGVAKPAHGKCFKYWAKKAMQKISDVKVTTTHDYIISYKYAWACTTAGCKTLIQRHSRSVDPEKHCCSRCKGRLQEVSVSPSNPGDMKATTATTIKPKEKRKATGFSLFVQQNSRSVRERMVKERQTNNLDFDSNDSAIPQSDVLKECSRLWKLKKENESRSKQNDVAAELIKATEDLNLQ